MLPYRELYTFTVLSAVPVATGYAEGDATCSSYSPFLKAVQHMLREATLGLPSVGSCSAMEPWERRSASCQAMHAHHREGQGLFGEKGCAKGDCPVLYLPVLYLPERGSLYECTNDPEQNASPLNWGYFVWDAGRIYTTLSPLYRTYGQNLGLTLISRFGAQKRVIDKTGRQCICFELRDTLHGRIVAAEPLLDELRRFWRPWHAQSKLLGA